MIITGLHIKDNIVFNIIVIDDEIIEDFNKNIDGFVMPIPINISLLIGDTYDGEYFYREGRKIEEQ